MQTSLRTIPIIFCSCLLWVALTTAASAQAPAEPTTEQRIEKLYEAGKAALSAKQPAEALKHFKAALSESDGRSAKTWQMLLAVAVAYKDLGYPVHTLEYFKRFLTVTAPHQDIASEKWKRRRVTVEGQITELEKALSMTYGFVNLTSTPPGAIITVDGRPGGADENAITPFRLVVTPGGHLVSLSLDGHDTAEQRFEISAGATSDLTMSLTPTAAPAPPEPPPTTSAVVPTDPAETVSTAEPPDEGGSSSLGPWIVMGSGAALGVVGIVMSILASGESDAITNLDATAPPQPQSDAELQAIKPELDAYLAVRGPLVENKDMYNGLAVTMYAVSVGAIAGGLVWALLSDGSAEPTAASALTITPTPGGVFGQASWRF